MIGKTLSGLIASISALSVPLFSISAFAGLPFAHCLVEEVLRHQQEVDGLALFVASAVGILLVAPGLDVRLIQTPAAPDRTPIFLDHFLDERRETNRPPVDRRMLD
ncbi:hypothetical protein ACFOY5_16140 [Massilia aurea]|jgi:uncharacterized membrane protein|uniref:hypothetical protein n=1 Tax=Massilia aurea TaxID=373040 RepID=UPI002162BE16|nr:hypothetical protein [Massilia aurea]MCS0706287.1 hypothetical protein [Massilia aurea]